MDYQSIRKANVYFRNSLAGQLEKHSHQSYSFQYHTAYLNSPVKIPIGCAFPLRSEPYFHSVLHPFFDNLILEGWLLSYAERWFHIDKKNRFALLMAVGHSSMGALSIRPLDPNGKEYPLDEQHPSTPEFKTQIEKIEFPSVDNHCPSCLKPLHNRLLIHPRCATRLFNTYRKITIELDAENPLDTFSRTVHGGSISGAQRKGLFSFDQKRGLIYPGSLHSELILKPDGDYPELPANEHLTMTCAREIGFKVPPTCIIKIPRLGLVYMVRRFDRLDGVPLKMEDMAQIIGELSDDKYEGSCEKVAQAIQNWASAPRLDLNEYFRRLIFCFLTANADMHLKNWSLLEKNSLNGEMDLSPCYDLINTRLAIPKEQMDIGLSILGKKRNLQRSYFERFGLEVLRIEKKFIDSVFSETKLWLDTIETLCARSYLTQPSKKKYVELARERFKIFVA